MKNIVKALENALGGTYLLYLKTQTYHWNVTGPQFHSLHLLFENQYLEMAPAIDRIAERLRTLEVPVPTSLKFLKDHSSVDDKPLLKTSETMIKDLIKNQDYLIKDLKFLFQSADQDLVTQTLASDRLEVHEKARWMLTASL